MSCNPTETGITVHAIKTGDKGVDTHLGTSGDMVIVCYLTGNEGYLSIAASENAADEIAAKKWPPCNRPLI